VGFLFDIFLTVDWSFISGFVLKKKKVFLGLFAFFIALVDRHDVK